MGVLSLHQTPQPSSPFLLRFVLLPALQVIIQLHLLSVVVDVAEAGSAVVVVDVPSYRHISPPVADLNARSVIVLAIMLTNATIVMMVQLAQLLFSTLMGIVQSIPTGMFVSPEAFHSSFDDD